MLSRLESLTDSAAHRFVTALAYAPLLIFIAAVLQLVLVATAHAGESAVSDPGGGAQWLGLGRWIVIHVLDIFWWLR